MIENPFTGECIDVQNDPKEEWVPKALNWLSQMRQAHAMESALRVALADLTPGEKQTEPWSGYGWSFKVQRPGRRFRSTDLERVFQLQQEINTPDALCPVEERTTYKASLRVVKQIEKGAGPSLDPLKEALARAEIPPGPPKIVIDD